MRILITGAAGLIGQELVDLFSNAGHYVHAVDLKWGHDLRNFNDCKQYCDGMDEIYHLMGVKGNPRMTNERPCDFMVPMLQCDTNMIQAAQEMKVKKFLYTSSIAVLNPETDKFPAWAKQTAETLIEAMRKQYPDGTRYCIVRPANVYGKYDNFKRDNLMVISDLIKQAVTEKKINLWDKGESTRDFINAYDVARAMIYVIYEMPDKPISLGSGEVYNIRQVAEIISKELKVPLSFGETGRIDSRTMDVKQLKDMGFNCSVKLENGIKEAINWAKKMLL